jgi:hypothetical protein
MTKLLAIRSHIPNPSSYQFPCKTALRPRDLSYDGKELLPKWAAGVHILLVADELDADRQKPVFDQK